MTDQTAQPTPRLMEKLIASPFNFVARMAGNPVILKELRGRMRGKRSFVLLTAYLGLISLFILMIYLLVISEEPYSGSDPEFRQMMGKLVFGTVILLELLLISFIGPALTAGAISSEREKQTYDLLRTTLLSARSLVWGKLGSALVYLYLLIFAALPIEGLAFLLGGVGLGELLISSLMLVVTAFFFCVLGIFFSSFIKRTLVSTVSAYASTMISFITLVMFFFVLIALIDSSLFGSGSASEDFLMVTMWLMISTNPMLAAIFSELVLIEDQSFFMSTTFWGNGYALPSPWIIFTLLYLALALLMLFLSIRFVDKPDR